jgi:hypothetical protein
MLLKKSRLQLLLIILMDGKSGEIIAMANIQILIQIIIEIMIKKILEYIYIFSV